jgi:hypothetical protein
MMDEYERVGKKHAAIRDDLADEEIHGHGNVHVGEDEFSPVAVNDALDGVG